MTQTIKIKDNSQKDKTEFVDISSLVSKIADKTLEQLEKDGIFVYPELVKDSSDLTKDQMVVQSCNNQYRIGNVMGYLGYGNERLVIQSRFSLEQEDYFLQYMLERVLQLPNIVDMEMGANMDNKLFSLFVFLFPKYLKSALRKGLLRTYVRRQYNDSNPKGTIDISRHIKNNTPFVGNIAYNQREYSCDNYLLQLIRHTIEYIKKKPYGKHILSQVKDEINLIIGATPQYNAFDKQKILELNKKHIVRHAYFYEYRALQSLSILILQSQKHDIGVGTKKVYGILFDGAWLWEEYINLLVKDAFYHPMNKSGKGVQRLFGGNVGYIYPDFISRQVDEPVVADAKYKPMTNISNADYFQLLAYMMRFDAKKGVYFYPETGDAKSRQLWLNKGSTYQNNVSVRDDIHIVKHSLHIPIDAENYTDFLQKIKVAEKEFVNALI